MKFPIVLIPAVFIIALPFLHSSAALDPVLMPRMTYLAACSVLLSLALIFSGTKLREVKIPSLLGLTFIVFVLTGLVALPNALAPTEAYFSIGKDILLILFLFQILVLVKRNPNSVPILIKTYLITSLTLSGFTCYQLISDGISLLHLDDTYALTGHMGHRNLLASALLLTLPFGLYGAWYLKGMWRILAFTSALSSTVLILLLKSRGSVLGLSVMIVAILCLFLWRRVGSEKITRAISVVIMVIMLGVTVAAITIHLGINPIEHEGELKTSVTVSKDAERNFTAQERILMWKATLRMIFDQPVTGVGPGQWKIYFPKYGSDIWRSRQGMVQFQRPHNDFLWIWSEQGIIGLMAYLGIFAWIVIRALRYLSSDASGQRKALILLMLSGMAAYFIVSIFSFPRERVFHQLTLFILLALTTGLTIRESDKGIPLRKWHILFSLIPLVIITYLSYDRWNGEVVTRKILEQRISGNWEELLVDYDEIKDSRFYQIDPTSVPTSFYAGLANLNLENYNLAEEQFLQAYQLHPYNIHVVNNIAGTYMLMQNIPSAIDYYEQALKIAPYYKDGILNLASAYFNNGEVDNAYKVLCDKEDKFEIDPGNYHVYLITVLRTLRDNLSETIKDSAQRAYIQYLGDDKLIDIHNKTKPSLDQLYKELETIHPEGMR